MSRTFGWVQNPNRLEKLKYIVGIFEFGSYSNIDLVTRKLPLLLQYNLITKENYEKFIVELSKPEIEISYNILKGKGSSDRKKAICSGVIQASIDGQKDKIYKDVAGNKIKIKKPYTDDWTSDGYLRWAISTGFVEYIKNTDTCKITDLGKSLINTKRNSSEEKEIFALALLSYPPVYRVLEILSDHKPKTKFEIGSQLGFKGEMGFTSIPQEIYAYDYNRASTSKERQKTQRSEEGDADKYARTIANWLCQMNWVEHTPKIVTETYLGVTNTIKLDAWQITRSGEIAIKRSKGYSKNPKIPKIVMFEMLATKVPNADYIRLRRAQILNIVKKEQTIAEIREKLKSFGIDEKEDLIKDELDNFKNIGITIKVNGEKYKLADKIVGLDIPREITPAIKNEITELKDEIRSKLHNINHEYLVLVDLAYSDANKKSEKNKDSKEFEIKTAKLFTEELDFSGERLGDANKPDVIISYDNYGTIIDNKSYKNGFNLDSSSRDKMARYIKENNQRLPGVPDNEWWKNFEPQVSDFTFMFVTSFLKGNFKKGLKCISDIEGINGAGIGVDNLLYLAESIKSGKISCKDFFTYFNNDEIVVSKQIIQ